MERWVKEVGSWKLGKQEEGMEGKSIQSVLCKAAAVDQEIRKVARQSNFELRVSHE